MFKYVILFLGMRFSLRLLSVLKEDVMGKARHISMEEFR